jgi:hypothetical protein
LKCREARKHLEGYLSGDLERNVLERVEEHLEACPLCREEFARQEEVRRRLDEMPPVEARGDFPDRVMRRTRNRRGKGFRIPGLSLALPGTVLLRAGAALALAVPVLIFFLVERPYYKEDIPGPEPVDRMELPSRDRSPSLERPRAGEKVPSPGKADEARDREKRAKKEVPEERIEMSFTDKERESEDREGVREKPMDDVREPLMKESRQEKEWDHYEVLIGSTAEGARRDSSRAREGAPAAYRNSKVLQSDDAGDGEIAARSDRDIIRDTLERQGARDIRLDREGDRPVIRYRANEATQRRIERELNLKFRIKETTPPPSSRRSMDIPRRLEMMRKN